MNQPQPEIASLDLVKTVRSQLGETINALSTTPGTSTVNTYIAWCGVTINRAAEAYCLLRSEHRIGVSKILVRPIIETGLFAKAAFEDSEFLVHKVHAEINEDIKRYQNMAEVCPEASSEIASMITEAKSTQSRLVAELSRKLNLGQVTPKKVVLADVARKVRMSAFYPYYRLYCQFTHGAYQAASGDLDPMTDPFDNFFVAFFAVNAAGWIATRNGLPVEELRKLATQVDALWISLGGKPT